MIMVIWTQHTIIIDLHAKEAYIEKERGMQVFTINQGKEEKNICTCMHALQKKRGIMALQLGVLWSNS